MSTTSDQNNLTMFSKTRNGFRFILLVLALSTALFSCNKNTKTLPILGNKDVIDGDTVYYTIPEFTFIDQDSNVVIQSDYDNTLYITDFFFTSCRTICPVMKKEMIKIQKAYKGDERVKILSHTLDPKHDTPEVLNEYAERLGADTEQWKFVTGDPKEIYRMANQGYLVPAVEDENQPDGITHSGAIIIVDTQNRIRGYYNGTDPEKVALLIKDIEVLLNE